MSPGELAVELPGGVRVSATAGYETGDVNAVVASLLGPTNAALAPLQPIFAAFDALKAVTKCVEAVPDCITQFSPSPLLEALPGLAKAIDKVAQLYPPMPFLVMAKGVLNVLAQAVRGVRARLAAMVTQANRIAASALRAAALGGGVGLKLAAVADCASSNLDVQLQNLSASVAPLNRLVGIVNGLLELAGFPCVPTLGAPAEVTEAALAPLDATVAVLDQVVALIPGSVTLLALPPAGEC
jgi:hypothetical protein